MMHNSRIGKLLVAHPRSHTGNAFSKSVIYIYQDDSVNGTVGVVLNKPSRTTISELTAQQGIMFAMNEPVYMGGPVNKNSLVMLHTDEWHSANTASAGSSLRVSSDTHMLYKMADGIDVPAYWRLFIGTSNWQPGQLQAEIDGNGPYGPIGNWLTCEADESIMFNKDGEELWHTALGMCSQQTINQYF